MTAHTIKRSFCATFSFYMSHDMYNSSLTNVSRSISNWSWFDSVVKLVRNLHATLEVHALRVRSSSHTFSSWHSLSILIKEIFRHDFSSISLLSTKESLRRNRQWYYAKQNAIDNRIESRVDLDDIKSSYSNKYENGNAINHHPDL